VLQDLQESQADQVTLVHQVVQDKMEGLEPGDRMANLER
jgi:hypothetical protein